MKNKILMLLLMIAFIGVGCKNEKSAYETFSKQNKKSQAKVIGHYKFDIETIGVFEGDIYNKGNNGQHAYIMNMVGQHNEDDEPIEYHLASAFKSKSSDNLSFTFRIENFDKKQKNRDLKDARWRVTMMGIPVDGKELDCKVEFLNGKISNYKGYYDFNFFYEGIATEGLFEVIENPRKYKFTYELSLNK